MHEGQQDCRLAKNESNIRENTNIGLIKFWNRNNIDKKMKNTFKDPFNLKETTNAQHKVGIEDGLNPIETPLPNQASSRYSF